VPGDRPLSEEWLERLTDLLREAGDPEREIESIVEKCSIPTIETCELIREVDSELRNLLGAVTIPGPGVDVGRPGEAGGRDPVAGSQRRESSSRADPNEGAGPVGPTSTTPEGDRAGSAGSTWATPAAEQYAFGLRFDDGGGELSRESSTTLLSFGGKMLRWEFLKTLANPKNNYVGSELTDALCARYGTSRKIDHAVYVMVGELRKELAALGLEILPRKPDWGYRLAEFESPPGERERRRKL
jgi:hypothetical protein